MSRRRTAVALALLALVVLCPSAAASAQAAGPDIPASTTQVAPPPEDLVGAADPESAAAHVDDPAVDDPAVDDPAVDDPAVDGIVAEIRAEADDPPIDLLASLLGTPTGSRRWASYELSASAVGMDHLLSAWARMVFETGKLGVLLSGWVLEFVLRFDLGRLLVGDVGVLSGQYAQMLDGGTLPLRELALLLAVAHAGWQILRHRAQAAVPELLVAALVASAGGYLLLTADTAACRGLSVMGDLTTGTLALADPAAELPTAPEDWCAGTDVPPRAALATEALIADVFVHEPYLLLQWGVLPPEGSACRQVADALVAAGPWGTDDLPRLRMGQAGCEEMAAFNAELSVARVAGGGAYALGALTFATAVLLTAGTLLVAQVAGALLVLAMPFAVVIGIAPGAGRAVLARWGRAVLEVAVLFMTSGFLTAFLTTSVGAVQSGTQGRDVLVRMLASTAVAWSVVVVRGRVVGRMRVTAHGMARRAAGDGAAPGVAAAPARPAVAHVGTAAGVAAGVDGDAAGARRTVVAAGPSPLGAGASRALGRRSWAPPGAGSVPRPEAAGGRRST